MDSAEVTIGVEYGRGGLATCDRAMRRRTMVDTTMTIAPGRDRGSVEVHRTKRESW